MPHDHQHGTQGEGTTKSLTHAIEKISIHDHLCLIYKTKEEQFAAIIPFVRLGLERNEKFVYIVDDNTAEEVVNVLRAGGIDIDAALQKGAFSIASKKETYLRTGRFDPDEMIQFLKESTDTALREGYTALRITGEMTWMLGSEEGTPRLMEYESKLNLFFPGNKCLAICQYNYNRFAPNVLADVIHTHPIVVSGNTVCKNFYYIPTEEFLKTSKGSLEVDRLLNALLEREHAESVLIDNINQKEEYLKFFTLSIDPMCIADPFGNFKQVNPAFTKLTGYTDEELISRPFLDFIAEEDRQRTADEMKLQVEVRSSINFENHYVCKDGTKVLLSWTAYFDKKSGVTYATARDITKTRKIEAALISNEARLHTLVQTIPDLVWLKDTNGVYISCNSMFERFFGAKEKDIVGKTDYDFVDKNQADYFRENDRKAMEANGININEEWITFADDGHRALLETIKTPLRDQNGMLIGVLGIGRDITERKKNEAIILEKTKELMLANQELKDEKVRDEALLASIGEGMIATDNEGIIIATNHIAEKILGHKKEELLGEKAFNVIQTEDEKGNLLVSENFPINVAISTKTTYSSSTLQYIHPDGKQKIPVAVMINPVSIGGEIIGAIAIFRDITKEKEIEKLRNDLLSLASHQLRTPLSGTKWLIETLIKGLHGPLTDKQREYLDELNKINDRMTSLVHDMLGVLRAESGASVSKKESVSLPLVINNIISNLSGAAKSRNITLRFTDTENNIITTDPLLLGTVLDVLVSNAINYSNPGSEVVIRTKRDLMETIIDVQDFGIGIPEQDKQKVFDRFYRAENAKIFDTRGTGLGLYIADTLTKKIDSFMTLDSEVNKGTTFHVHIPHSELDSLPETQAHV